MCCNSIWKPKTFLGCADLKTGSIILSILNIIGTITNLNSGSINKYNYEYRYVTPIIPIAFSVIGIIGILMNKPVLVKIFDIYLLISFFLTSILTLFGAIISIMSINIIFLAIFVLLFIISGYTWSVVHAYHKEMTSTKDGPVEKAAEQV
ncbi:hypothetical protein BCR32DRAFT_271747 [Anaeromyces robustus]|uniref:Uncharacterized protein n=1 Tax=Anaeromyces robustus TaxID=1754192 RepID=A0A1Y1WQA1_9FUNG|nr:hypothetical protein BCR32DRAFT_271747 [Anaeromyces robustus]|eukprot:ORX75713.1 hypothetical protein BCR32DRAFT_271747 [Anaeromyces robustus]